MKAAPDNDLIAQIEDLRNRLEEAEQLIEAIKAGEVDAFAVTRNDRSEIFTLQTGDYAYRILVENFNEGALSLSEDGLVVYTNSYFHELVMLPYEKVIGNKIEQFIHPESRLDFMELFRKGLAGQSKGEINLISDGKKVPVYASITSLYPTLPSVGMIVTDLSEKKINEKLLLEANKLLEEKNIELAKSNTELASFSYIASHDLQEPLRKIQTFASRLAESEVSNLSETGKTMFTRMQLSAKRMQTLIDDLLAYSRTNNTGRTFERIELSRIIEEVKQDLKEEIKEKEATIETRELCEVNILQFQFRQLLHNLIGNSLKFSRSQVAPHISIKGRVTQGKELKNLKLIPEQKYSHITLSDNGIGFEPVFNEKIFELFQRLNGREDYRGTGIGLSIVKRIVENHNGIITAQGEPDKGARFDIYIPYV